MSGLDDIQRRADEATEGPWRIWKDGEGERGSAVETSWSHDEDGADTELITDWCKPADAEFIAHARTDVPELLALVRTQQATLAAVLNLANTSGRCGWRISADELRKVLRGES